MKEKLCLRLKNRGFVAKLVLVTSLVLTVTILGATYAFRSHNNELDNRLKAHSVSGAIIENGAPTGDDKGFSINPGGEVTKSVQFKNTSDAAVFVRVAYAQTWMDEDGTLLAHSPSYATLNWNASLASDWESSFFASDGWYYYKKVLKAGETTTAILDSVEFLNTPTLPSEYADGKYQLTFVMEVVQCSDEEEVNEDASLATFGKTATVSNMTIDNGTVTGGTVEWN